MREPLQQLLRAVRLERDAFVWMDFNDRATADALIFVAVTRVIILLGFGWNIRGLTTSISGLEALITSILNSLIFWLLVAGITFAVAKFLLNGSGQYAMYLRMVGFAYPTLLLLIFSLRLGLPAIAGLFLGSAWFLAVVARGVMYEADLPAEKAALASIGGLVGWYIVQSILANGII